MTRWTERMPMTTVLGPAAPADLPHDQRTLTPTNLTWIPRNLHELEWIRWWVVGWYARRVTNRHRLCRNRKPPIRQAGRGVRNIAHPYVPISRRLVTSGPHSSQALVGGQVRSDVCRISPGKNYKQPEISCFNLGTSDDSAGQDSTFEN